MGRRSTLPFCTHRISPSPASCPCSAVSAASSRGVAVLVIGERHHGVDVVLELRLPCLGLRVLVVGAGDLAQTVAAVLHAALERLAAQPFRIEAQIAVARRRQEEERDEATIGALLLPALLILFLGGEQAGREGS